MILLKKIDHFKLWNIIKNYKKRLNITINDYKEYSKIEIELIFDDNKYGKFINISDKEKQFYHIYFDDSNKEIERNYFEENEKVKVIKIIIDYQIKSFKKLFSCCENIKSIFFKKFYRNNVTDMSYMFIIKRIKSI